MHVCCPTSTKVNTTNVYLSKDHDYHSNETARANLLMNLLRCVFVNIVDGKIQRSKIRYLIRQTLSYSYLDQFFLSSTFAVPYFQRTMHFDTANRNRFCCCIKFERVGTKRTKNNKYP